MQDTLLHLLDRCPSRTYADARYEHRVISELVLDERGAQLTSHDRTGGLCRIASGREVAHVAFTELGSARELIDREARHMLSASPPEIVSPAPRVARIQVQQQLQPIEERIDSLRSYYSILADFRSLRHIRIYFRHERCRKYFANCTGTFIDQDQQWTFCLLSGVAENGQSAVQVLTTDVLEEDLRAAIEELGHWTELLITATLPACDRYTVILDPQLAGAMIHETIGHLSEADNTRRSSSVEQHFRMGSRVAGCNFSVVDDATVPGLPGSYAFDDEGVPGQRTLLVREGTVASKLHTLRTAAEWRTETTGNARAADFACEPIVRCSNTIVCPGEQATEELIESVEDGLYLRGVRGGSTYGDRFRYAVCGGNRIRNGRLAEPVGNVTIRAGVNEFLRNIVGIGSQIPSFSSPFCIKKGQPWMPIWSGSPALKVTEVPVEA